MYTFLKNTAVKKIINSELPSLCASLIIAEAFYEFGSFLLECGAFLVTWFVISFLLDFIYNRIAKKNKNPVIEMPLAKNK
jgi:hypothetical protein